ncbi:hypothetical protein [Pleionea sediminis]|uniref:hypothetical protein n=1 Tax=Pleionea sediminis TaxID=2569479 RepID=UPI0011872DBC|nr:hypothetical protein [Pleionea sediminis]
MFHLFGRNKQLLDEESIEWIFDTFAWAIEHLDKDVFDNETRLILPNNDYFPGAQNSADGMADLILKQVKTYAGMSHWPTQLLNVETSGKVPPQGNIIVNGQLRGEKATATFSSQSITATTSPTFSVSGDSAPFYSMPETASSDPTLTFTFHPQQLRSPEGIIAHFAQGLSNHLLRASNQLPPGGRDYLPMASELVGIFMGFGIVFANSAIVARAGGCGGCGGGQSPVRQVILNQDEATYALALFCQLKDIDKRMVKRHLNKHLRGFFKAAIKDCRRRLADHSLSIAYSV